MDGPQEDGVPPWGPLPRERTPPDHTGHLGAHLVAPGFFSSCFIGALAATGFMFRSAACKVLPAAMPFLSISPLTGEHDDIGGAAGGFLVLVESLTLVLARIRVAFAPLGFQVLLPHADNHRLVHPSLVRRTADAVGAGRIQLNDDEVLRRLRIIAARVLSPLLGLPAERSLLPCPRCLHRQLPSDGNRLLWL